jgi:enamine deaminase RidA (YjgF/YER057c/UK114 family)
MKLCLETAGSSLEHVLKCNVYCASVDKFAVVDARGRNAGIKITHAATLSPRSLADFHVPKRTDFQQPRLAQESG